MRTPGAPAQSASDGPWLAQPSALAWTAGRGVGFTRAAVAGRCLQHRTHKGLTPRGVHSSHQHLLPLLGKRLSSAVKGEGPPPAALAVLCAGGRAPRPHWPCCGPSPECPVLRTRGDGAATALSTGTQADVLRSVCWLTWLSRWVIAITSERTFR